MSMELKELQNKIKEHGERFKSKGEQIQKNNIPNHVSFPFFKAIEELGEIADLIVRKYGFQRKEKEISEENFKEKLGEELVDVITTLIHIANFLEIDLEECFKKKLTKMDQRWNNQEY